MSTRIKIFKTIASSRRPVAVRFSHNKFTDKQPESESVKKSEENRKKSDVTLRKSDVTNFNTNINTQNLNVSKTNHNITTTDQNLTTHNQNVNTQNLSTTNQNVTTANQNVTTSNLNSSKPNTNANIINTNSTTQKPTLNTINVNEATIHPNKTIPNIDVTKTTLSNPDTISPNLKASVTTENVTTQSPNKTVPNLKTPTCNQNKSKLNLNITEQNFTVTKQSLIANKLETNTLKKNPETKPQQNLNANKSNSTTFKSDLNIFKPDLNTSKPNSNTYKSNPTISRPNPEAFPEQEAYEVVRNKYFTSKYQINKKFNREKPIHLSKKQENVTLSIVFKLAKLLAEGTKVLWLKAKPQIVRISYHFTKSCAFLFPSVYEKTGSSLKRTNVALRNVGPPLKHAFMALKKTCDYYISENVPTAERMQKFYFKTKGSIKDVKITIEDAKGMIKEVKRSIRKNKRGTNKEKKTRLMKSSDDFKNLASKIKDDYDKSKSTKSISKHKGVANIEIEQKTEDNDIKIKKHDIEMENSLNDIKLKEKTKIEKRMQKMKEDEENIHENIKRKKRFENLDAAQVKVAITNIAENLKKAKYNEESSKELEEKNLKNSDLSITSNDIQMSEDLNPKNKEESKPNIDVTSKNRMFLEKKPHLIQKDEKIIFTQSYQSNKSSLEKDIFTKQTGNMFKMTDNIKTSSSHIISDFNRNIEKYLPKNTEKIVNERNLNIRNEEKTGKSLAIIHMIRDMAKQPQQKTFDDVMALWIRTSPSFQYMKVKNLTIKNYEDLKAFCEKSLGDLNKSVVKFNNLILNLSKALQDKSLRDRITFDKTPFDKLTLYKSLRQIDKSLWYKIRLDKSFWNKLKKNKILLDNLPFNKSIRDKITLNKSLWDKFLMDKSLWDKFTLYRSILDKLMQDNFFFDKLPIDKTIEKSKLIMNETTKMVFILSKLSVPYIESTGKFIQDFAQKSNSTLQATEEVFKRTTKSTVEILDKISVDVKKVCEESRMVKNLKPVHQAVENVLFLKEIDPVYLKDDLIYILPEEETSTGSELSTSGNKIIRGNVKKTTLVLKSIDFNKLRSRENVYKLDPTSVMSNRRRISRIINDVNVVKDGYVKNDNHVKEEEEVVGRYYQKHFDNRNTDYFDLEVYLNHLRLKNKYEKNF